MRPTEYKPEFNERAYKLCLLGATDKQMADFFGVTEQTINNWKEAHPEFFESIKRGKLEADANVAKSLYHRALGYSHKAVKFATYEGKITDEAEYTEHYPPDTAACMAWLKNRQPEVWRDKVEHEVKIVDALAEEMKKARERAGRGGQE